MSNGDGKKKVGVGHLEKAIDVTPKLDYWLRGPHEYSISPSGKRFLDIDLKTLGPELIDLSTEETTATESTKQRARRQGWYAPDPEGFYTYWLGYSPQYEEEERWIIDYIEKTGQLPTMRQSIDWKSGQDKTRWTYHPESLMGQLGFRTEKEYFAAEGYGLEPGIDYPLSENYQGLRGPHEYTYKGGEPTSQPFTFETALQNADPYEIYSYQLQDYLNQQQTVDYEQVQGIRTQAQKVIDDFNGTKAILDRNLGNGSINQNQYDFSLNMYNTDADNKLATLDQQMSRFMTPGKYQEIMDDAKYKMNLGWDVSGLPFYKEVGGLQSGPLISAWVQKAKAQYEATRERSLQMAQRVPLKAVKESATTGNEQNDFAAYVDRLNLAEPLKNWMFNNFGTLYSQWMAESPMIPFITWLQKYLAR